MTVDINRSDCFGSTGQNYHTVVFLNYVHVAFVSLNQSCISCFFKKVMIIFSSFFVVVEVVVSIQAKKQTKKINKEFQYT